MFRSPLDVSSDSKSEEEFEKTESTDEAGSTEVIERPTTTTESLPIDGELSVSEDHDNELPQPNVSGHHANFLLAGLLEDYSHVRAAEVLNSRNPEASYTRHSRDARVLALADQIFSQNSVLLDAHNVLPAAFTSPETRPNRSQYLSFIDGATLRALQEGLVMPEAQNLKKSRTVDMANMALAPALTLPASSQYQGVLVSTTPAVQLGRYHSEFQQVKLLGQGGYGRVFHVVNAVDRQHYAIKRIPLSAKVYSKWLQGGDESARTFQEIRTLSKMDHPNIVRYFGAWLEAPPIAQNRITRSHPRDPPFAQKRLAERPALTETANHARPRRISGEYSDGIVFGDDTESDHADVGNLKRSVERLIAEMPSKDHETTSAYSLRDSEIFTDGRSRSVTQIEIASDNTPMLCVQMSLHPMTLSTYLTTLPKRSSSSFSIPAVRHCFHLLPSLRLLLGIICGLQYLHSLGIVHRDVKPGNILLSESTGAHAIGFYDIGSCYSCPERTPYHLNPRIADFGLVAEIKRSAQSESLSRYKAAGTELYRPPATFAESVDEKLDVFALGMLFFELLWRFDTKTERAMVLSGLQRGEMPASFSASINTECGQGVGEKVVSCIKGMVDKDAKARWSLDTVKAWAEGLLGDLQEDENARSKHQS